MVFAGKTEVIWFQRSTNYWKVSQSLKFWKYLMKDYINIEVNKILFACLHSIYIKQYHCHVDYLFVL